MNELQIDTLLDAVANKQVNRTEAEQQLQQAGVAGAATLIDEHIQAVQLVQQMAALQVVTKVRTRFEADRSTSQPSTAKVRSIVQQHWLRIAAAVILLPALFGVVQISTYQQEDMLGDLQAAFAINTPRSNNSALTDTLLQAFNQQQYATVTKLYATIQEPSVREQFLAAYAYQQENNHAAAATLYQSILNRNQASQETLYNDDAMYYLAIASIELAQPATAYALLKDIYDNEQHTYHEKVSRKMLLKLWWMK